MTEQEEQKKEEEQDLSKVTAEKQAPSIEVMFLGSEGLQLMQQVSLEPQTRVADMSICLG